MEDNRRKRSRKEDFTLATEVMEEGTKRARKEDAILEGDGCTALHNACANGNSDTEVNLGANNNEAASSSTAATVAPPAAERPDTQRNALVKTVQQLQEQFVRESYQHEQEVIARLHLFYQHLELEQQQLQPTQQLLKRLQRQLNFRCQHRRQQEQHLRQQQQQEQQLPRQQQREQQLPRQQQQEQQLPRQQQREQHLPRQQQQEQQLPRQQQQEQQLPRQQQREQHLPRQQQQEQQLPQQQQQEQQLPRQQQQQLPRQQQQEQQLPRQQQQGQPLDTQEVLEAKLLRPPTPTYPDVDGADQMGCPSSQQPGGHDQFGDIANHAELRLAVQQLREYIERGRAKYHQDLEAVRQQFQQYLQLREVQRKEINSLLRVHVENLRAFLQFSPPPPTPTYPVASCMHPKQQ